jgi:undecaprenyl-diphosphatase
MLTYIILGALQGLFEWLPISSEGVVGIASRFLIKDFQPLEIALFSHLGTFLAALIYFRRDWFNLLTFKDKPLFRFLLISVPVSGLIGFLLYGAVKNMVLGSGLLILTGFGLLLTAYCHKNKKILNLNFNLLAVLTGIVQGLAVIPGLSRSGSTIFVLSWGKFDPEKVLKISYMMSAPVVLGMAVFLFWQNPVLLISAWPVLIVSFLVGILTLSFLFKLAAKIDFFKFALLFAVLCFLGAGLEFFIQAF